MFSLIALPAWTLDSIYFNSLSCLCYYHCLSCSKLLRRCAALCDVADCRESDLFIICVFAHHMRAPEKAYTSYDQPILIQLGENSVTVFVCVDLFSQVFLQVSPFIILGAMYKGEEEESKGSWAIWGSMGMWEEARSSLWYPQLGRVSRSVLPTDVHQLWLFSCYVF